MNISSKGAKITSNAFKTSLVAQAGSGKLEGEFKAGEYTISGNGLNMSETISTSASYSVNSSKNSSSYNTDNNLGMSAKLGPITVGIESDINKVSSAISNSVQALAAFITEVFTDFTNNNFGTDPQQRSQEKYIKEEKIKQ